MPKEIERKYLVKNFDESLATAIYEIKQGYIFSDNKKVVRVRTLNDKAYLTLKYVLTKTVREEFEYEIPVSDANYMLKNMCKGFLTKKRHIVIFNGMKWEVDVFYGNNEGLILAEIELQNENQKFDLPPFIDEEVTNDLRYSNHNLI